MNKFDHEGSRKARDIEHKTCVTCCYWKDESCHFDPPVVIDNSNVFRPGTGPDDYCAMWRFAKLVTVRSIVRRISAE